MKFTSTTMRLTKTGMLPFVDMELGEAGDTSGLRPYGRNIIVKMDTLATMSQGDTGILFTDDMQDLNNIGSTSGCIVAMGPEAFRRYEDMSPWVGNKPQVGDRVIVVQYSGSWTSGADGHAYRIMDQNCVIAGIGEMEQAA